MFPCDAVSIVIPHYGDPEPTQALIRQLHAQAGGAAIQIIIADDCSPQPFPDAPGIDLVRRVVNGGFGAAVNAGVALARHDLTLVLNSDIEIAPTFVEELLRGAQPWMPAVVGTVVHEDGSERCVGRNWPTPLSNVLETVDPFARLHGVMWFENQIGNDVASWHSDQPEIVDWVIGVSMLFPTADFRAIGGMDERYFMNCEEIDLQRRLHEQRGLPVVLLPGPRIDHVGGGSSDPARRTGWLMDARFRYHEKWNGGPALYAGLLGSAALNLMWNGARSLAGRDIDALGKFTTQVAQARHGWKVRK